MLTDTRDPEDFSRDKPKDESPAVVFTPILGWDTDIESREL